MHTGGLRHVIYNTPAHLPPHSRAPEARGTTLEGEGLTKGVSGRLNALTSTMGSSVNARVVMGLSPRINARCALHRAIPPLCHTATSLLCD